ncbi:MAG TPA: type II 3-dehydroquinate dehydratase [Clostridiales bacterium]|nr:type II 3-dehydroquinate dehydratase [Clostridiales bacterium]
MYKILVINGPNMNMLGTREKGIYGSQTLDEINQSISTYASSMRIKCDFYQSNSEGDIIDQIHRVKDEYDGCIINAGAYTHYSYAIHDAIKAVGKPFIEVHMSNVYSREEFRHKSVIAPACKGVIAGFGRNSYLLGISALYDLIKQNEKN